MPGSPHDLDDPASSTEAGPLPRGRTVGVRVGSVMVGGGAPVVVNR